MCQQNTDQNAPTNSTQEPISRISTLYSSRIALLDCNGFYAACEEAYDPSLRGLPVAVLSLNDGCIIAANRAAKALGARLGMVWHLSKREIAEKGIQIRSANFDYYAQMSAKVMRLLVNSIPEVEVYSIDEAWLNLTDLSRYFDLPRFLQRLQQRIREELGLPVAIGLGTSKVTAKIANHVAKRQREEAASAGGLGYVVTPCQRWFYLQQMRPEDLWGIAAGCSAKLRKAGVHTALDYALLPDHKVDELMGITGLRHVHACRGRHTMPLEQRREEQKMISSSRSFRKPISQIEALYPPIVFFIERCCEKLLLQKSTVGRITVFLRTDKFDDTPQKRCSAEITLSTATHYPPTLLRYAIQALHRAFEYGYAYKKAGILFSDLRPMAVAQQNLFENDPQVGMREQQITDLITTVNTGYQNKVIDWALFHRFRNPGLGIDPNDWTPRSELRSDAPRLPLSIEDQKLIKPWW